MKKFLFFAFLLLVAASSVYTKDITLYNQETPVVKATLETKLFTKVAYACPVHLVVKKGANCKVEVEGSEKMVRLIRTEVKSGVLHIYWDGKGTEELPLTIYITAPVIESLKIAPVSAPLNRRASQIPVSA